MTAKASATSMLYHDIYDHTPAESGFAGLEADRFKLSRVAFQRQLDAIAEAAGRAATAVSPALCGATFHMTFDDGGSSSLTIADMLEERGWIGHFFIATGFLGKPGFLEADGVRELHGRGHVVGSHSVTHPAGMAMLEQSALESEWRESIAALATILGARVTTGAIPGGSYAPRVARAAAKAGIELLFTSEPTATPWTIDRCMLLGRFSVVDTTTEARAAALARGEIMAVAGQYMGWNARRAIKRAAGPLWNVARAQVLARRRRG